MHKYYIFEGRTQDFRRDTTVALAWFTPMLRWFCKWQFIQTVKVPAA